MSGCEGVRALMVCSSFGSEAGSVICVPTIRLCTVSAARIFLLGASLAALAAMLYIGSVFYEIVRAIH